MPAAPPPNERAPVTMSPNDPFNDFFSVAPGELESPRRSDGPAVPAPSAGTGEAQASRQEISLAGAQTPERRSPSLSPADESTSARDRATAPHDSRGRSAGPTLSTNSGTTSDLRLAQPAGDGPTLAIREDTTPRETVTSRSRASLSYTGLGLLLIPAILGYVRFWMPELRGVPFFQSTVNQLAPAMGLEVARFGPVSEWQAGHSSWLASFTLLGALVTFGILTHSKSAVRQFGVFAAGFTAACGLLASIASLISGATGSGLIGVLLLGLSTAIHGLLAYRCTRSEPDPENAEFQVAPPDLFLFAALALIPAISLGRAVGGKSNRDAASRLSSDDFEYLWSLMWLPVFSQLILGGTILVAAYLGSSLVWRGKNRASVIPGIVATVVLIGLVIAAILPWTKQMGDNATVSLTSSAREASVSDQCTRWVSRSTGTAIAVAGPGCREVRTYDGHFRTSATDMGFSATTPSNEWLTTTGHWVAEGTVTGSYDTTLVVAGAGDPFYHSPLILKGFDYTSGEEKWAYKCGEWEPFLLTFSGSDGGDDPESARVTVAGAGESVVVECRGVTTFLDPQTGIPR